MGTRVPVQHYNLRSANSFIGSSLHDLNTVDTRPGEIEGISDVDRDGVTEDSLDNVDESNSVDCMHNSYRNPLPLHGVGVEEDGSSRPPYDILSIDDISPIETARARFLQFIVDHFINEHVIEAADSSEVDYGNQPGQDKLSKRKLKEAQYEGDPRFVLPLMYVANLYETLVNDVNMRLNSLDGIREKTIGVALEAAGGLYRKLAKKFPRKGPYTFKRRELATSLETRTRFPELVIQEEKRVRFVVVNGLVIVEKPNNMTMEDAECHKVSNNLHLNIICSRFPSTLNFTLCTNNISPCIKVNIQHSFLTRINVHILHTCRRFPMSINRRLCPNIWLACNLSLVAMSGAAYIYCPQVPRSIVMNVVLPI
ncbi:PPR containing protein isoform X3 [Tasmannia lanceolata]|uniref:PPR containing protein isoform X3 n=1 Tax=Tasmannia lanceolata TaxID=3420 RepID=UPI004063B130